MHAQGNNLADFIRVLSTQRDILVAPTHIRIHLNVQFPSSHGLPGLHLLISFSTGP